jgi:hypothetical protein
MKWNKKKQKMITVWYDYLRVKISLTFIITKIKKKKKPEFLFHHNFVVSLLSFVAELVRWQSSILSFDIVDSGCSITMDGNCWLFKFVIDSFVGFKNGRSSSGPRKFKLNLRILERKQEVLIQI